MSILDQEELRREREYLISWAAELRDKEDELDSDRANLQDWDASLGDERRRLEKIEIYHRSIRAELELRKLKLEEASVPLKDKLEEILLLLELEEDPVSIADKIRDHLGIVDVRW